MAHVIKIQYENSLRRLTWTAETAESASFARLEGRIRELFKLPASAEVAVTYTDGDGDAVTMATDHDLADALVHQRLNPLRLRVATPEPGTRPPASAAAAAAKLFQISDLKLGGGEGDKIDIDGARFAGATRLIRVLNEAVESADFRPDLKDLIRSAEPLFRNLRSADHVRDLVVFLGRTVLARLQGGGSPPAAGASPEQVGIMLRGRIPEEPRAKDPPPGVAGKCPPAAEVKASAPKEEVVHHGVICDVCNVSPIVGLRWKAIKKHDYDLCPACFEKHGNADEYTKIEQQMFRPRHCVQRRSVPAYPPSGVAPAVYEMGGFGVCRQGPALRSRWGGTPLRVLGGRRPEVTPPVMAQAGPGELYGGKLNARFVRDVTILDGTELSAGTRFTKVWRILNTGCGTWPADTVLVHVGGDELGQAAVVPVAVPERGLPPAAEMDAAVEFTAPEKAGRYFSYWRLQASAFGPKFGHRVWVLIQVSTEESVGRAAPDRALPNAGGGSAAPETKSQTSNSSDADPSGILVGAISIDHESEETNDSVVILETTTSVEQKEVDSDTDSVIGDGKEAVVANETDAVLIGGEGLDDGVSSADSGSSSLDGSVTSALLTTGNEITADESRDASEFSNGGKAEPEVEGEEVNGKDIAFEASSDGSWGSRESVASDAGRGSDTSAAAAAAAAEDEVSSLDGALAKLGTMGFADVKLNRELLEKNGADLRKTLDDLCAAEEWDPIMEELEEMGFYDTSMNRRLMFKNKGSVKRVVKDLVQLDRQTSVKQTVAEES